MYLPMYSVITAYTGYETSDCRNYLFIVSLICKLLLECYVALMTFLHILMIQIYILFTYSLTCKRGIETLEQPLLPYDLLIFITSTIFLLSRRNVY